MQGTFLQRLVEYLRKTEAEGQFKSYAIQRFGEGIAAISDDYQGGCEVDVYFDGELWEPTMPEIWEGGSGLFPPALAGTGIGVLPGVGRFPPVQNFFDALQFACNQLKPKNRGTNWFPQAQEPALLTEEKLIELASC